jgi:hypothetical protein
MSLLVIKEASSRRKVNIAGALFWKEGRIGQEPKKPFWLMAAQCRRPELQQCLLHLYVQNLIQMIWFSFIFFGYFE